MTLTQKIARLVAERGWNQEAFARHAGLNRNTVRQILTNANKRLHNQTVRQCADALGVPVHDLHELPLEKLLPRVRRFAAAANARTDAQRLELATQPELQRWMERHPERAKSLTGEEVDELLSLQGTGGPLTRFGVEHFVGLIERKRELKRRIEIIAGTEYLEMLEQLIGLIYEKIQPYRSEGQ